MRGCEWGRPVYLQKVLGSLLYGDFLGDIFKDVLRVPVDGLAVVDVAVDVVGPAVEGTFLSWQ
jgi:hypothetical protein